ncbi:sugar phosphate nucleotidyltransferase [Elusimicrobiota bacterium]
MKAMVLAAGAGTRLRPLTWEKPKPMVPILNRPNIFYILDKIARSGIKDVGLNLYSYPEQILKYVDNGAKWDIKTKYSREKDLRGTAGCLAPLKNFFKDETFIVLSGDGLSDVSILELLAYHKRNNAIATIVLAKTDAKLEFGLVQMDDKHKIYAFLEKPGWEEVFSPYVNTGIYVLEPEVLKLIPDSGAFDFAKDLWPKLLLSKAPLYGYIHEGYWTDIGNFKQYRQCHKDILDGKINIPFQGREIKPNIWIGNNSKIGSRVKLEAPIVIGDKVKIENNAKVGAHSVIGDRCHIHENANIKESILWDNVDIARNVYVSGCVLANNTKLKESVSFYEGAILQAKIT